MMTTTRLSRRQACRLAVAGPVALVLGDGRLAAGEKTPALRYILASSMYGKMKLEEILPEVRKTGTEWIDLWPEHHANQREQMEALGHERFAELLAQHRVKLGMTTRYDLGPMRLGEELRVLHKFGATLVVTGSQSIKGLAAADIKPAMKRFVEQMEPHVSEAERLGVTIAIENHGHALLNTPDSLRYFAEFAQSPFLGIALAPYHLPQDAVLLARLIEDLGPKVVHFYAWQEGRGCMTKLPKEEELLQLPGRGPLDFKPLLAALRKVNFRGWTEIFMHPVPRGIPIADTREQVTDQINRCRLHLESLG